MLSIKLILILSILFILEVSIVYLRNKKYSKSPKDNEYDKYESLTETLRNNTLTLAALTIAILAFFRPGSYAGTQTLLIYGLSLLFFSAFLYEFSGLKKIVYFIQRRTLHYWFYSVILAISTLYVNSSRTYDPSFTGVVVVLSLSIVLVFVTHAYSFYLEIKTSRT